MFLISSYYHDFHNCLNALEVGLWYCIISLSVIKLFLITCNRKCDIKQEWIKRKLSFHSGYSD